LAVSDAPGCQTSIL